MCKHLLAIVLAFGLAVASISLRVNASDAASDTHPRVTARALVAAAASSSR